VVLRVNIQSEISGVVLRLNIQSEGRRLNSKPVVFPMCVMKPLKFQWLQDFYAYIKNNSDIVQNRFRAVVITSILDC